MSHSLEFSGYTFGEHEEFCLKAGSAHDNHVLIIPPLFDEMNRVRSMLVDVMEILTDNGIGSILPDLPGSNESLFPQDQASLSIWKQALADCFTQLGRPGFVASLRGGCLIDDFDNHSRRWRLTPAKGRSLLRTMMRTRVASDKEAGISTSLSGLTELARSEAINLAGNQIGSAMFSELQEAVASESSDIRLMKLDSDKTEADGHLAGTPLWLRAEPDSDAVLSSAIANDLIEWVRS